MIKMRSSLISIYINMAIIVGLFFLAWGVHASALLVFSVYGLIVSLLSLKQNMYGIVNSFNHLAFVVGMLFSMKLYGPKSIIKPFNPATGLENIKFNAKFQKVSSGFSFLFWLALGAIIEFSVL